MSLGDAYIWFILLAAIAAFSAFFLQRKSLFLYFFPFYLLTTFFVEYLGIWLSNHGQTTTLLYNIFTIFEFMFYFWILRTIITNRKIKNILIYIMIVYPPLVILNMLFLQKGTLQFHTFTYSLGCFIIVASAIVYFFELFQSDMSTDLVRDPYFWICSGLLFFYSCGYPLFALTNFFAAPTNVFIQNYNSISSILNILLYSSFIIASLCRIRIMKFSS